MDPPGHATRIAHLKGHCWSEHAAYRGIVPQLHWHTANEWAIMLTGKARVSVMQPDGKMFIDDVGAGDLGTFRLAIHIPFRAWKMTDASFSWCSTKALSPKTKPSFSRSF